MDLLFDSLLSAFWLLVEFDPAFLQIVTVSLRVSFFATVFASILGIPMGLLIAYSSFPGKRFLLTCLNTLLALPTVVIGLLVYSFISRRAIFGSWELLYTQKAIIIGQIILIWPLVTTLTIAAISKIDSRYRMTALTLGASQGQMAWAVLREARYGVCAAIVAAFGRVIAEVGISMMLGGNAKGFTRTMTTAMALEYDKGEFVLAVALGITLMTFAFFINMLFHLFQGRTKIDAL
ncbi:ABC transporter permease [Desulfotalea psychrophila]|uniref:Related to ABC transporter, permease protein n=1 Tax=Desulfotalea psychrophila (strain LSv54 / DSM 12343) TaxID=177439 RepID=Q6ARG6_DESPS|nr:ABC transporter permease [Desulfotalea psychrophila]CAG35059.1 related to ABC transporter, permease protein [Desulfotalea psychrophila LSv54]